MNDETKHNPNVVRFLINDENDNVVRFVYRPDSYEKRAENATIGVKFAQRTVFIDHLHTILMFKTPWQRFLYRLRHPIAYSNRYIRILYRRVKKIFVKDNIVKCKNRFK